MNILLLSLLGCFAAAEKFTSCTRAGHFAFTFDQSPSENTGVILNTLQKYKVKATFHITVKYLENPIILAYLRKAVADGHLIGIFVENEEGKDNIPEEKRIETYLRKTSILIKKYINYTPKFLRFPHPGPNKQLVKKLEEKGYVVTAFNLDSGDYEYMNEKDPEFSIFKIFKRTVDQILPPAMGAFISVQRDSIKASAEQSDMIVSYVLKKGYRVVRLDECVGISSGSYTEQDEGCDREEDSCREREGPGEEPSSGFGHPGHGGVLEVDEAPPKKKKSAAQASQALFSVLPSIALVLLFC